MIALVGGLAGFELRGVMRRWWYPAAVAIGVAAAGGAAAAAAAHEGAVRADSYRASAALLLLLGGLGLALLLGAAAVWAGAESGHLGLLAGSGAPRTAVAAGRTLGRLGAFVLALAVWLAALEIGSVALGRGLDGPLAVHAGAAAETAAVVLLAATAVSTVLGPTVTGIVALLVQVGAQAVVNLEAAADQGRLGAWDRAAHVAYNLFPRAVYSPMIVGLQNRGEGGAAAPRFEINDVVVPLPAAGIGTVLWTLFWCVLLGAVCVAGMRRRPL